MQASKIGDWQFGKRNQYVKVRLKDFVALSGPGRAMGRYAVRLGWAVRF